MSNYFDIEDILCEDEQVEIKLEHGIYRGAQFDCSLLDGEGHSLPGQKMSVPYWMGKRILQFKGKDEISMSKINIPEMFCEEFQKALNAEALILNLRVHMPLISRTNQITTMSLH
jgi:hypothetical protein